MLCIRQPLPDRFVLRHRARCGDLQRVTVLVDTFSPFRRQPRLITFSTRCRLPTAALTPTCSPGTTRVRGARGDACHLCSDHDRATYGTTYHRKTTCRRQLPTPVLLACAAYWQIPRTDTIVFVNAWFKHARYSTRGCSSGYRLPTYTYRIPADT